MFHICTPWKRQKTSGFQAYLEGIWKNMWTRNGQKNSEQFLEII